MADSIEIGINGQTYGGWKSATVERSMEQLAGGFELSISELAPQSLAASQIKDGAQVSVMVAGEVVLVGFIDEWSVQHGATDHQLVIRGREATADLVDCSALPKQWQQRTLLAIVQSLVADYGIDVICDVDTGSSFATWSIDAGETLYENIDRLARHRGLLVSSDGLGHLLITTPGTQHVGTALVLGQNILSGSLSRSQQQRFSEYHLLGQRQRDDDSDMESASTPHGSATDAVVSRLRRCVACYEDANASLQSLSLRAAWQAKVNAAKGQRVTLTVQGWRHADGLWQPNTLVTVDNALLRLSNETLLISGVRYVLDSQGSRSELTLVPRNSWLIDTLPDEVAS